MKINTKDNTVKECLGKKYYIDFYQREYIWKKGTVDELLNDIFCQFELSYDKYNDRDLLDKSILKEVMEKFNWYFLNIYITNSAIGDKEYIVDGQQRLTTLTLVAVKLFHLTQNKQIFKDYKNVLEGCIHGNDMDGNIFWIDHEKRKGVMNSLMDNNVSKSFQSVTEENIKNRYKDISNYLNNKNLDDKKLNSFIYYFLLKLVLVELKISQKDTPMIFEVINDRGEELKPFEILKGKLLGCLNKDDVNNIYNKLWQESINKIEGKEDKFFSDYLKAKFVFKRNTDLEKLLNNRYHRYIFEKNDIAEKLKFRKQDENYKDNIKNFITKELPYYTKLYATIRENKYIYLYYNNAINVLLGQVQYQNIMAACEIDDSEEEEKIKAIAKEIDRLYILLNLNNSYDKNNFQQISYNLNKILKGAQIDEYRNIFDKQIEERIEERIKEKFQLSSINSLLDYNRFKNHSPSTLNMRILRYLLARIEVYICENSKPKIQETVYNLATKTGPVNGYHIEHILANNGENIAYFESKEEFEEQRNRLGGLLLLKGKNNISSGNETYSNKLKTYSGGLMLGETLTEDCYKSNLDFTRWNDDLKEKFKPIEKFDKEALEHRTKVLYELIKEIWEVTQ